MHDKIFYNHHSRSRATVGGDNIDYELDDSSPDPSILEIKIKIRRIMPGARNGV